MTRVTVSIIRVRRERARPLIVGKASGIRKIIRRACLIQGDGVNCENRPQFYVTVKPRDDVTLSKPKIIRLPIAGVDNRARARAHESPPIGQKIARANAPA